MGTGQNHQLKSVSWKVGTDHCVPMQQSVVNLLFEFVVETVSILLCDWFLDPPNHDHQSTGQSHHGRLVMGSHVIVGQTG